MVMAKSEQPEGIGGWLILVVLGLVISPIRITMTLFNDVLPIFTSSAWQSLTTSGSPLYHSLWAPLIWLEVVGNVGAVALGLVTLVLLFRKSKKTPAWAIAWLVWAAFFVTADYCLANLIPAVASQSDHKSLKEMSRSITSALIWIPYFKVSKRVKNTFIK